MVKLRVDVTAQEASNSPWQVEKRTPYLDVHVLYVLSANCNLKQERGQPDSSSCCVACWQFALSIEALVELSELKPAMGD